MSKRICTSQTVSYHNKINIILIYVFSFFISLREHCENLHWITVTNEELANMFKEYYGYASRFDAFSKQNNNLEITEICNSELEKELQEFGLTLQDIMDDLFVNEMGNN